ncbi:MAG TPA: glycosyltransferase [Rhodanobacteraceae bacterium]|nr:glycosyltransferase [Rhodanobacteraceae bacterium]
MTGPQVSIVVPVYNQLDRTRRCLRSLAAAGSRYAFEVIVVDDGSTDGSAEWLAGCVNVRVRRLPANAGFIAACNAGAAIAHGKFLVFLNNDTEVRRDWLDALMACFESMPDCGLVGAKLIGADGRLQEAGAMVFADGQACNYGRRGDPSDTRYGFLRDTDYCSGACIALPKELFLRLGGFDARYAPAYYEDTDLAFAVRAAGYRVIYQPRAEVVHAEGATAGTAISSGVKRYQYINRDKFVAKWKEALAAQPTAMEFACAPERCAARNRAPHILVIDIDYPRPERDAGSLRMFNILQLMREMNCHVQFWAMDAANRDSHARALEDRGIEIVVAPTPLQRLRWWYTRGAHVDIVWLSRLPTSERHLRLARRHAAQAKLVFDTVDLHFLRYERGAALQGDASAHKLARRFRRTELSAVAHADVTLVVSDYELSLLHELVPTSDVRVLSTIHTVWEKQASFEEREGLLFLGNFEHTPNIDAVRWLLAEIMPRLREHQLGVPLHIAGYAGDKVLADLAEDDVIVHGFVRDLDPLLAQVRVSLAPLRFGAGVKGKINLAMSRGLPVVTTFIGAEGMGLRHRFDAMIADGAEAFASAVVELYRDESLWNRVSEHGLDNVRRQFSPDRARLTLSELLVTDGVK